MRFLLVSCLLVASSLNCAAELLINEFAATNSDHLLVREPGGYPRVGNTVPWQSADYDDSAWQSGDGPFGFGTSISLGTSVSEEVQNRTPSLYLRKTFNVSAGNAASGSTLQLRVRYDDGFIAFLNGVEVARRNMGFAGMFGFHDQTAYNSRSSTAESTINLGIASALLQAGDNLLCIQVHNQSASAGGDMLLAADLRFSSGTQILDGDGSWNYFAGLAEPSGGLVDYGLLGKELDEAPDVLWGTPSFDDSTWPSGIGPIGYETSASLHYVVGVDLETEMKDITPSVYIRNAFTATAAEANSAFPLSLEVDFDDGMIVYLNGFEIFRDNLGSPGVPVAHDVPADSNHPATGDGGNPADRSETVTLAAARDLLVAGDNVIGIQLHNSPVSSGDLIARVTLSTTGSSPRDLVSPTDPVRYFVGTEEPSALSEADDIGDIEELADSENDWIEIRNTDPVAVTLDGWSLSDDPTDQRKWNFPAGASIAANGYYVVVASGLDLTSAADGTTYAHTNFKLSASGGRIVLTRPDDQVEDQLSTNYPAQSWRYSYGRQADGTFGHLALGTPGAANVGAALAPAPVPPQFNNDGGFYSSTQSIVLTGSTTGSTIRYSTDGTDPLNGTLYSSPINVSANTVIRARSFLTGSIPSGIVTHTYLINQGPAYQSLPAMCFSGDPAKTFYGPNTSGGPTDGEGVFAINGGNHNSGTWDDGGDQEAFNNPMSSGRASEKYGSLEYLPISGEPLRIELGMRAAGSDHTRGRYKITDPIDGPFTSTSTSSTKFQKPSLNIFFRPEFGERPLNYPFFGSDTVTEFESFRVRAGKNDWYNPFIKDELMRRIFINTGNVGSHGNFTTVWINGVYKGYYNLAERVREGFMQAHYNSKQSWDVQQVNSFSSGDPTNWNKMIGYLRETDLSTTAGYAGVHDFLDVDNYIDYILVNAYAAMGDWPHNNWIAARERSSTGRWRFYVWDAEGSFGFSGRSTSTNSFTEQLTLPSTRFPTGDAMTTTNQYVQAIYTLLKASPEFRLRMADRGQKHLFNDGALVTSRVSDVYNELKDEVSPIIQEAGNGTFRSSFYTGWIANNTRYNALLSQLGGEGAWPSTEAPTLNQHGGEIAQGFQMTLSNPNGGGTIYFTTDGADPRDPGGAVAGSQYSTAIQLSNDTRLRARVLESGTWSPEIDVEFTFPFAHPTFLPISSADWTEDTNWSSDPAAYPDGVGVTAEIPGVPGAARNANLRAPVTIGRLIFDLGSSTSRSRVRDRSTGNTLTFSDPGGAEILVTGDDEAYAELEVEAGTILTNDLRLEVQHEAGDPEWGALRLRSGWSGSGGLTKAGSGIATLTGNGKTFTGTTVIERGVLQLTEPATPTATSSVRVQPGGQLRLTSGSGSGDPPRNYAFGGTLTLSGFGRGDEISDGEGNGKRGTLRYEPGNTDNHAIISTAITLAAPAEIHVQDSTNQLELSMPLGGTHALTKSGGGTLVLGADQSALAYPITVDAGTLEIRGALGSTIDLAPTATLTGHGSSAAIGGEGAIVLDQTLLQAPASNASHYSFVFGSSGAPDLGDPAAASNGTAILETAPTGVLALDFYLSGSAQAANAVSQGGFIVPLATDLEIALSSATIRVFSQDPSGVHQFDSQTWSLVQDFTLNSVATEFGQPAPFTQVRILELTNGNGSSTSFEDWRQSTFSVAALGDPSVSGPLASPFGDGVSNLLRYSFGIPHGASASALLPRAVFTPTGTGIAFPFANARSDITVIVEASSSLDAWSGATILFDSSSDLPPVADAFGRITITEPLTATARRFYRVRVIQLP